MNAKEELLQQLAGFDAERESLEQTHSEIIQATSDSMADAGSELNGSLEQAQNEYTTAEGDYQQYLTDLQTKATEAGEAFDSVDEPTDAQDTIDAIENITAPTLLSNNQADIQTAFDELAHLINTEIDHIKAALTTLNEALQSGAVGKLKEGGQKTAEALQLVRNFSPPVVDTDALYNAESEAIESLLG